MEVQRVIVSDNSGAARNELNPNDLISLVAVSEINGEHALKITTMQELDKNDRLLLKDKRGKWHEYVVEGIEGAHDTPGGPVYEYYCPWSLQHDLEGTNVTGMPGTGGTPATAAQALTAALAGTVRWTVGTVAVTTTGSASFWRLSGWEALAKLVEVWGGEIDAAIYVGTNGVVSRSVNLLTHIGLTTPNRRFDYGHDVAGIKRTVHDQLWTCRVLPLGAGEETESGGYGRKITIESVNSNIPWLENEDVIYDTRVPAGNGWEYPCQIVENSGCKTPADLKAWALEHLEEWTTPKVTYTANVAALSTASLIAITSALGDEVVVVDKAFKIGGGLRIQGRVMRMEEDLLDPSATVLTISNLDDSLASTLDSLSRDTTTVRDMVEGMSANQSSVEWVSDLLARINAEANATGGYTYITEGEGIRCYDHAVTDPLVGAEASAVCEVKGGTMRIANTKDGQGNWEWKTVFISGRILAELIDAIGASTGTHAQLTPTGLDVYDGANLYAHFGAEAEFYDGAGHKLITIGAYSNSYYEGKIDFGNNIGFLSGVYDEHMEYRQLIMQGTNRTGLRGPSILLQASGLDSDDYGDSDLTASSELSAKRAWTSNPLKHDEARFTALVRSKGTSPRASMTAASHETEASIVAEADTNHAYAKLRVDRIELTDPINGLEQITNVYPTHGAVPQDESIAANSYRDYTIAFNHTYPSPPNVLLTIYTTTSATASFDCDIYLRSVSTTEFTARIINREGTPRSPGFRWLAIG